MDVVTSDHSPSQTWTSPESVSIHHQSSQSHTLESVTRSLVIFDTVPGGAGSAIRIARSFGEVLDAARAGVEGCDCGEETSCYGCLRATADKRME